jgi:phosphatidylserine/phosphatidylglycerophosphate/cardiolipin synthase-like enzyme
MAKFLTTKQISSALEELIQEADKILYLVSPFLKLSKDFQELINSRNKNEKKTIIIYGKSDLTPEQLKFLTGLRHVYLKFHENLHAKCYVNDTKLIITSLNFYEYSMIHNKEMGVLYDNTILADQEIYTKALEHVKFIEENSNDKPFELTSINTTQSINEEIKKVETPKEQIITKTETISPLKTTFNGKFLSATALSKELGISAKDLQYKFEKMKWIEKKNDEWVLTSLGKSKGAEIKKGQYGDYIAYPETVVKDLI